MNMTPLHCVLLLFLYVQHVTDGSIVSLYRLLYSKQRFFADLTALYPSLVYSQLMTIWESTSLAIDKYAYNPRANESIFWWIPTDAYDLIHCFFFSAHLFLYLVLSLCTKLFFFTESDFLLQQMQWNNEKISL